MTRDVETPYSGMLPGLVAGAYTHDECHSASPALPPLLAPAAPWRAAATGREADELPRPRAVDLRRLCSWAGARMLHASATGLDLQARTVLLSDDRPPLPYDVLSLDVGIAPAARDVPGAAAFAIPVKPIDGFSARWQALRLRAALPADAPLHVTVVGGGAGGVELALAMHAAAGQSAGGAASLRVSVVTRGALLPSHAAGARRRVAAALAARGIAVHTGAAVVAVEADGALSLSDGRSLPSDAVVWCTQAEAPQWLAASGLACDAAGCVRVADTLQSASHDGVFAAGDCAALASPRPKAGVFAVRAGPPLTANLRAALLRAPLQPWAPQPRQLALLALGDGTAVASWGPLAAGGDSRAGRALYRLKDRIDRAFMRMYCQLPPMAPRKGLPVPPSAELAAAAGPGAQLALAASRAMRCGGCGAKVGADVLSRVLAALPQVPTRPEVTVGIGARADDAAAITLPAGAACIASLDFFRAFIDDPFTVGAVAATHALGDAWAMGAPPTAALALAQVPAGSDEQQERELVALMAGACAALRDADVALAGGHTCEGAELAVGFAVIAAAGPSLLTKGGLRPGDALLLTKPLGTGVVLAANAAARAPGRAVQAALASMRAPSGAAARVLLAHGAAGATDVTGFGLLGHAVEMARASRCRVAIDLAALPLLPCAAELAASGVASSLAPANARAAAAAEHAPGADASAAYPLVFDPQTAGGLLAGVPAHRAAEALAALRDAGCVHAAIIGEVLPLDGDERPILLRGVTPSAR